jgi:hypothetical protein
VSLLVRRKKVMFWWWKFKGILKKVKVTHTRQTSCKVPFRDLVRVGLLDDLDVSQMRTRVVFVVGLRGLSISMSKSILKVGQWSRRWTHLSILRWFPSSGRFGSDSSFSDSTRVHP